MEFTNKCCCPNKCSGSSGGGTGSLSFGSILLIIGFSMAAIYFIGGFIFYKFVKKANGMEALPNHTFWVSLPTDIKVKKAYFSSFWVSLPTDIKVK